MILVLGGRTTLGAFVVRDNGAAGTIVKRTARAAVLETVDGRWVIVPKEELITSRAVSLSDAGKAHRYQAAFSVRHDTDINRIPAIIEARSRRRVLSRPNRSPSNANGPRLATAASNSASSTGSRGSRT